MLKNEKFDKNAKILDFFDFSEELKDYEKNKIRHPADIAELLSGLYDGPVAGAIERMSLKEFVRYLEDRYDFVFPKNIIKNI